MELQPRTGLVRPTLKISVLLINRPLVHQLPHGIVDLDANDRACRRRFVGRRLLANRSRSGPCGPNTSIAVGHLLCSRTKEVMSGGVTIRYVSATENFG